MRKIMLRKKGKIIGFMVFILFTCTYISFAEPSIWVDPSTGRITVKATREQMKNIEEVLPNIPTRARQIEIKAEIIEISSRVTKKFGTYLERLTGLEVPAGPTGEGGKITYGPGPEDLFALEQGAFTFDFYKLTAEEKFRAVLNMLVSQGKAEILSNPRVVTLSGEVAGIYVTTEVPYLSSITYETVNERQVPVEHYEYATVGIVLQVLPRIVGEDLVEMRIIPLVGNYEIIPEFGAQHPIFKRQVSPTNVTVKDGESLVIGGLISKEKSKQTVGLPVVSSLPIVGSLFKSQIDTVDEKSLLITIKPHILKAREIEGRVKRTFHFKYALAEEVAERIKKVISPQGSVEVNPMEAPPNSIVVKEREDKIKLITSLVSQIGSFEQQKKQKVYQLTYTSLEEAKTAVESLLSSRGSVVVKEEENALLVEDGAYQISMIDSAISVLEEYNSSPQEEFFLISHINPSEAIEEINPLLSTQGFAKPLGENIIMVRDNSLIIEKVKEKLKEIDVPKK